MKPTNNRFNFVDRTKKLSRNEKIVAAIIIIAGGLFLYNEWSWRAEQDRDLKESTEKQEAETREYCEARKANLTLADYQANTICREYERKIKQEQK